MKRRWRFTAIMATAFVLALAITGTVLAQGSPANGSKAPAAAPRTTATTCLPATTSSTLSAVPLTSAEKNAVVFMREEEKLARDVYTKLYAKWKTSIFSNIAASEATHMQSVKVLLDRYKVADPVGKNAAGVFTNPELQAAYNSLVAQGSKSLTDAYKVGVTIEKLDIEDLQALLPISKHADVTQVAKNLLRASQSHLKAFNRQLGI